LRLTLHELFTKHFPTGRTGCRTLVRESLFWSLPVLVALTILLATGLIGPLRFVGAGFAALLLALYPAYTRMRELEKIAAWLAKLSGEQAAGVVIEHTRGTLSERLMHPMMELARTIHRQKRRVAVQQQMLVSVIEAAPDPILVVDNELVVVRANVAAKRNFSIGENSPPLARVLRDPGVLAAVSGALEAGTASNVTFTPTLNRQRLFSARVEPLVFGEGRPGVLVALREQTEQVMIERMRSDFVANASHEIRNPLASIQGIIETLRGPARHDPQAREMFLELMAGEAARMRRLVDDLLSLSRIELAARQPPTERCEPKVVLEQVIERMYAVAAPCKVRLEVSISPTLPEIVGDPDQLHQLFVNLIDNAIKYGGEGKTVWIEAAEIEAAPPDVGPVAGRSAVRISVRDQGPGIAREHIPRLTERFYRVDSARSRKLRGTGLGLAIVKHVLRRHQGHLAIQSELSRGSTFILFLPTAACHGAVTVTS
jgi:two-component system phosphate regulon sensor histidine kinase PhoR